MEKSLAIIGGGWYGCHIALALKRKHPLWQVIIFEKNSELLNEISGNFGIRLHAGPHYPRSPATRHDCHKGFVEFRAHYEEIVNDHKYSIYGLGNVDSNGEKSKVDYQTFASVCEEFGNSLEIDPNQFQYKNLDYAANIDEPSIAVGPRLRKYFLNQLTGIEVKLFLSTKIIGVQRKGNEIFVETDSQSIFKFDNVINASGFKSMLPTNCGENLPLNMEVIYQICSAFLYKRINEENNVSTDVREDKPFSFIVMDGWFPCVMPYDDRIDKDVPVNKYMLTHGKWTILGSYRTHEAADEALGNIHCTAVENTVRNICESELRKFFPTFFDEFEYEKLIMTILPKIKTDKEFRSAITFQDTRNGLIHIIPGKINNIFDAEREVSALIATDLRREQNFICENHWRYVKGGTLDDATTEIKDKHITARNTCSLQAYKEILNLMKN